VTSNTVPPLPPSPAVIVAEKHPIARAALAALLSYDGYRVFQAEDLNSALAQILSVDRLAAVLVDLDLAGWKTIIHRAVNGARLVITMRGDHRVGQGELEECGVHACFNKPIIYSEVAQRIRSHVAAFITSPASSPASLEPEKRARIFAKS
jgi:DNA-binding response OmpR family regulator